MAQVKITYLENSYRYVGDAGEKKDIVINDCYPYLFDEERIVMPTEKDGLNLLIEIKRIIRIDVSD